MEKRTYYQKGVKYGHHTARIAKKGSFVEICAVKGENP